VKYMEKKDRQHEERMKSVWAAAKQSAEAAQR